MNVAELPQGRKHPPKSPVAKQLNLTKRVKYRMASQKVVKRSDEITLRLTFVVQPGLRPGARMQVKINNGTIQEQLKTKKS